MSAVGVPAKLHAALGASVAARWMACPGSVRLSQQVPVPVSTAAADEGTRAHALAEACLRDNNDPADAWLGTVMGGYVVTEEMCDAVRVYIDHCREIMGRPGVTYWIERKFSLEALNPPAPMFGTSDFVAYEPAVRTLHVSDLKFGQGVLVEVTGSKQLRYYALGALLAIENPYEFPVDNVRMTIVQPRMGHSDGLVRSEEISVVDLLAFAAELLDAARKTLEPDAALLAGSHCRFCPASGICPAQRDHAQALAQIEFSVEPSIPPAPETMPIEMVAEMLPQMDVLEDWIKACRAHVQARLEAGLEVPGYKLVAKRALRRWTETVSAEEALKAMGYAGDEVHDIELKSPAQIEKLVGKKGFATSPVSAYVEKKSSGHKMVPASDPSPALVISRGEEFAGLLTSGE